MTNRPAEISQLLARAPERFYSAHFGGSGVREDPDSELYRDALTDFIVRNNPKK
jgi:hypothetical protein